MLAQSNKSELNVPKSQKADEWTTTDILKSCLKCKYWYFSHFFPLCKSHLNKASGRREHIFAFELILKWMKQTQLERVPTGCYNYWSLQTVGESQTRLAIVMEAEPESNLYPNLHKFIWEFFSYKCKPHNFLPGWNCKCWVWGIQK